MGLRGEQGPRACVHLPEMSGGLMNRTRWPCRSRAARGPAASGIAWELMRAQNLHFHHQDLWPHSPPWAKGPW